ncbi:Mif2/CENP-C like-domain-containing protein [Nemania sp. FL0916]|nr:Mif2/CENP-C like-domain-containing protein [Nemania sp. FL0916]
MAPRPGTGHRRQTQSQNEQIFALGKAGRKTGIVIPESGRVDKDGFEPVEDMFSSPDKELQEETFGRNGAVSEDEQDMEIDDGSAPGPATTRRMQQNRLSLPRARSPMKTNLNSPARQNPHVPPTSSPTRGTVVTARERSAPPEVARRLNFSRSSQDDKLLPNGHVEAKRLKNQSRQAHSQPEPPSRHVPVVESEDDDEDEPLELIDTVATNGADIEIEPEEESPPVIEDDEPPVIQESKATSKSMPAARKGRKPKPVPEVIDEDPADDPPAAPPVEEDEEDVEPVKKRKGRPKAAPRPEPERQPTPSADPTPSPPQPKASKRGRPARTSTDDADENDAEPRVAKRQKKADKAERGPPEKAAPTKEKAKPGRKRKSSGVGVDSPMIQRGPPLPKSRGLVTIRREEATAMKTTRSGRASFRPLQWWKGDHVEYDEEQENVFKDAGAGNRHFKMPTVKGIVRTEETHDPTASKRRGRPAAGRKPGRRPSAIHEEEEDIERDDWEHDEGRVTGEVIAWKREYEFEPPGEEDDVELAVEELAVSENAIQTRDIKDATFKFAKTLTLPFFGSGVVDLPPGAHKRPKNARMRHLVFFVHTGHVLVTIAQSEFAIAKGGMFFVPRGNEYQIRNETNRPSRIFFAQGSEMFVDAGYEGE